MEGRRITYAKLLEAHACREQRNMFHTYFGVEGVVTVELAVKQADLWDWAWAAKYLLSPEGYAAWDEIHRAATVAYRVKLGPVWDATIEARKQADKVLDDVRNTFADRYSAEAWDAGIQAQRVYMEPFYQQETLAIKEGNLVLMQASAKAFAEIYIKEGNESGTTTA